MSKKITVTLSDKAAKYLDEIMGTLDFEGEVTVTQSIAISHALEELAMFEECLAGETVTGWAYNNYGDAATEFNADYLYPLIPPQ